MSLCRYKKVLSILFILGSMIPRAHGLITLTPGNGGSASPPTNGGTTFHYFVSYSGSPALAAPAFFQPTTFTPLDPTVSFASDELKNAFTINIRSNAAFTSPTGTNPSTGVISFYGYPNTGTAHPAPIAAVNGVPCTENNGNGMCMGLRQVNVGILNLFYAAKYPTSNSTISVSFYPTDMCTVANAQGVQLTGCSGGAFVRPTVGSPTIMQLGFNVHLVADGLPTTAPTGTPVDTITNPVTLAFQVDSPKFACPSTAVLNSSVTPGDGSILIDASVYGTTVAAGAAPVQNLFVVGNDGSLPDVTSNFNAFPPVNSILTQVGWGLPQRVSGFKNSSATETHAYQVSFVIQDRAGIFVPPSLDGKKPDPNACLLNPVETASIQAFLGKSNCFIATAAFYSIDSPPVAMLREFRDSILLKSSLGSAFVRWYYRWSPGPAEWLIQHQVFRIPVLLLLAPLELFAWLCLHPSIMMSLWVAYFSLMGLLGLSFWRRRVSETYLEGKAYEDEV